MSARLWGPCMVLASCLVMSVMVAPSVAAQSLRGSPATVERQNLVALQHDFTFLRDAAHVRRFVDAGYLLPIASNRDYSVKRISFPYARPEVALFLSRLGRQYRDACGEMLVVTSLTRPTTRQPWNASPRSVHPTGMAVDLRRSTNRYCRQWLESVLLHLEGEGVVEAVRENRPPHYHVAVFPRPYAEYVAGLQKSDGAGPAGETRVAGYRVRSGDSLWRIARAHGLSIGELRAANDLRGNRIYPGQLLRLDDGNPGASTAD
ncbi:MAG: DUF5715 family protein [Gemmatimonadota bacterium]